jgi:hypothetical protein
MTMRSVFAQKVCRVVNYLKREQPVNPTNSHQKFKLIFKFKIQGFFQILNPNG